jgi:integrase
VVYREHARVKQLFEMEVRPQDLAPGRAVPDRELLARMRDDVLSFNTRKTYKEQWRLWERWSVRENEVTIPADPMAVVRYITEAVQRKRPDGSDHFAASTMSAWCTAIDYYHARLGYPPPGSTEPVMLILMWAAVTLTRAKRKWRALSSSDVLRVVREMDTEPYSTPGHRNVRAMKAHRDACLFMLGFAGAFRRSELAAVTLGDLEFTREGLYVSIPRSKTDQTGEGAVKAFPLMEDPERCVPCYVVKQRRILEARTFDPMSLTSLLIELHSIGATAHVCQTPGTTRLALSEPLFRPYQKAGAVPQRMVPQSIHLIVRERLRPLGYDLRFYGAHSLRIGFVTEALNNGATETEVMNQTQHKTSQMLREYYRRSAPLKNNAVNLLWKGES